jgi:hypothetical protein
VQEFCVERFNLRRLNDVEVSKQYWVKISNRFAALEILAENVDISRTWESMRENIKASTLKSLGYYELKQCKL